MLRSTFHILFGLFGVKGYIHKSKALVTRSIKSVMVKYMTGLKKRKVKPTHTWPKVTSLTSPRIKL